MTTKTQETTTDESESNLNKMSKKQPFYLLDSISLYSDMKKAFSMFQDIF